MALTPEDVQTIAQIVSQMLHEQAVKVAEHGVTTAGSWSATDDASRQIDAGTAEATIGKTYAILGDDGDTGLSKPRLNLVTTQVGDQYGPIGNERIIVIPTEDGPVALMIHGADDSPGTPLGERWITHRNPTSLIRDAYIKFTNDGVAPGNGKGGIRVLAASFLSVTTSGGHTIVMDDVNKKITFTTAGGQSMIMDDNTNTIQLQGSGTASTDEVVRQSDLQTMANNIMANVYAWAQSQIKSTATGSGWTGSEPAIPTATGSTKTYTA